MTGSTRAYQPGGNKPSQALAHATPAESVALGLLEALERRALDEAQRLLAPGFALVFPGPARFRSLEEMVAGAAGRYRRIAKLVEDIESFEADGKAVVYVRGTLYGVNTHGVEFSGVRFIDRFLIANGLIEQQDVWNDLAESGVLALRP